MERAVAELILDIDAHPVLEQEANHGHLAKVGRDVKRGVAGLRLGVAVGATVHQKLRNLHLVFLGAQMDWGETILCLCIK